MVEKVSGVYTVRGVMKQGRVQLLDEVEIENGSLLDITVVKTATQLRLEEKAAERAADRSSTVRFGIAGKPKSEDLLEVFGDLPKSSLVDLRLEGYSCKASLTLDDIQLALAEYALSISSPPVDAEKAIRGALRKRKRMAVSPNTKAATTLQTALLRVLDAQVVDDENALALWHMAAAAATQNNQYISLILSELPLYASEMDLCQTHPDSTGGHGVEEARATANCEHENALRSILRAQVGPVKRARRGISGTTDTEKLMKKEFKEIAGLLG